MKYYQYFQHKTHSVDMGLLQLLKGATEQRHVQVRILIPGDEQIKGTIDEAVKVCAGK